MIDPPFTEEHRNIWIENAHIGKGWRLSADHVVTGVPENDWQIDLPEGVCIDISPACHRLYYTGITRVAKNILGEIVRSMFLNSGQHLSILHEMKTHAVDMAECIQRGDFDRYGKLILKTWQQNKMIDSGTNPPEVERIIDLIKDYTLGYKLPGAGGGGYLYMVAKDPDAAVRIRKILNEKVHKYR